MFFWDSCTGITCTTPINECHKLPGFCSEGTCIYTPKTEGTLCSDAETEGSNPEGTCDGNGVCVPKGNVKILAFYFFSLSILLSHIL